MRIVPQAPELECRLFGPMTVSRMGEPIPPLRTRKGLWLLALLILRHDREVERAWLAGTLWPDSPESQSLYNLRRSLSDLRSALGNAEACLESPSPHTLLFRSENCLCDILTLESALSQNDETALAEAVAQCAGTLLEGCSEPWVVSERQTWEQRYQEALERLAQRALDRQDSAQAVPYLRLLLASDPLRESALRLLMQALANNGEIAAVIETYRDFRLRLLRELNAQPDPETAALYRQIRAQTRSPESGAEPAPLAPSPLRRIPLQITSLIGREEELHQIGLLLGAGRLLTLTGAGGVGKTRLALQTAEERGSEYDDGVIFVDLSPLSVPTLVTPTIAAALEVKEVPQQLLFESLAAHLEAKHLLLILDNCEHVLAECAGVVSRLLARCPQIRFLATSRQPLGLSGEVVYRVPALSLPDVARLTPERADAAILLQESSAFRLFVERATRRLPTFQLTSANAFHIAGICHDLDGLPLALELTASWLPGLTVAQISDRIRHNTRSRARSADSLRARQETIEGTIAWSYQLLTEPERVLLRRLSAFAGGFTFEAAQAVCADPLLLPDDDCALAEEIPDITRELMDKSLVHYMEQAEIGKYRLLETIRQYCLERLAEERETEAIQARFVATYLSLVEKAAPKLRGAEQKSGLSEILNEWDNVRFAMRWPSGSDTMLLRLRIARKLMHFWILQGLVSEGRDTLRVLLAQETSEAPTEDRAWALNTLGVLERWQADYISAYQHMNESLTLQRALGNRAGEAALLGNMGSVLQGQDDYAAALSLHEQSLAIFQELGAKWDVAAELTSLASLAQHLNDLGAANRYYQEGEVLLRELGERWGLAYNLQGRGGIARQLGDYENARRYYRESLLLFQEVGDRTGIGLVLEDFVHLAVLTGQGAAEAAQMHGAAAVIWEEIGMPVLPEVRVAYEKALTELAATLGTETFARYEKQGRETPIEILLASVLPA
jgi:predicted ATPase/DNA-binding SARP family transcriptional activator